MTIDCTRAAPATLESGAASATARDGLGRLWSRLKRRHLRRRTVQHLRGLSDQALKDIGLNRSEMELAAYGLRYPPRPDRYI